MNAVAFRNAGVADAEVLAELGRRSFTETFGHLYSPADLALFLENHTPSEWQSELARPQIAIRLGEADGQAVAFAKVGPTSLPFDPGPYAIELRQFYVLAPWHGTGVAARMMEWVMAEVRRRRAREVYLSVFVDNHRARRFYERYGFRFVRKHDFMVGTHADEDHILKYVVD